MSDVATIFRLNKPSRWTLHAGATLVIDGDRRILVDSGYFDTATELNAALQAAVNLTIEDITDVYFTHLHYDHYRPTIIDNQQVRIHMPLVEYTFISELMQHRASDEDFRSFLQDTHELIAPVFLRQFLRMAQDSRYEFTAIANQYDVHFCKPGDHLSHHVTTVDLQGHCPGQLGLEIATNYGIGIVAGDAVICMSDYLASDTNHHLIVHNRDNLLLSRDRVAQADFVIPGHGDWFNPKSNALVNFQENIL